MKLRKVAPMALATMMCFSVCTYAEEAEVNEYGLTTEEVDGLVESVKESVTTNYLEKYGITSADFELSPFDIEEYQKYDVESDETGAGLSSAMWHFLDNAFLSSDESMVLTLAVDIGDDGMLADSIEENKYCLEDTLIEQEEHLSIKQDDNTTQLFAFTDAVYQGIVSFLKTCSAEEQAHILCSLYQYRKSNSEEVIMGEGDFRLSVLTATMFDRVISENIQFE